MKELTADPSAREKLRNFLNGSAPTAPNENSILVTTSAGTKTVFPKIVQRKAA